MFKSKVMNVHMCLLSQARADECQASRRPGAPVSALRGGPAHEQLVGHGLEAAAVCAGWRAVVRQIALSGATRARQHQQPPARSSSIATLSTSFCMKAMLTHFRWSQFWWPPGQQMSWDGVEPAAQSQAELNEEVLVLCASAPLQAKPHASLLSRHVGQARASAHRLLCTKSTSCASCAADIGGAGGARPAAGAGASAAAAARSPRRRPPGDSDPSLRMRSCWPGSQVLCETPVCAYLRSRLACLTAQQSRLKLSIVGTLCRSACRRCIAKGAPGSISGLRRRARAWAQRPRLRLCCTCSGVYTRVPHLYATAPAASIQLVRSK